METGRYVDKINVPFYCSFVPELVILLADTRDVEDGSFGPDNYQPARIGDPTLRGYNVK